METFKINCLVIGGGVSGITIAQKLSLYMEEVVLIERNNRLAQETTSRNSEVIHAGIYYKPGSLKSELCIRGKELLYEYLRIHNLPHTQCGKFIVASSAEEERKLFDIYKNGKECGLTDLVINDERIKQYKFLNSKTSIFSPSTGIFDSYSFIESIKSQFLDNQGILLVGNRLKKIEYHKGSFIALIEDLNNSSEFLIETKKIINTAGLQAFKILNEFKGEEIYKPAYKKGEYYSYTGKEKLDHLIYPIPGKFSLGIHATIDLGNGIRFGPSSYDVNEIDYEISESQRKDFHNSIKKYWPSIKSEELVPTYSGIRPLLEGFEDFVIDELNLDENVMLSILGYSSPGLTSSLAMAEKVSNQLNDL